MTRRDSTLVIALAMLVGLIVAFNYIHVPYVVLQPGPVTDTLGTVTNAPGSGPTPVITISGAQSQPTSGHLYLTTVQSLPCGDRPSLWAAIKGWFSSTDAVEPYEIVCPPNETPAAARAQDARDMTESQSHAIVAAFTELGYTSTGNRLVIRSVVPNHPAAQVLRKGDVIESVNGTAIRSGTALLKLVHAVKAGQPLTMTVLRGTVRLTRQVGTYAGPGGVTTIGIGLEVAPSFNGAVAQIGISPRVIGGPSAGTALALGIIDKLTPGGLTGGRTIAGTGTVSPTGKVGQIGGIQQKIHAAAAAGATVFFAPAADCADAKGAAPSSMTLVSIRTLHDAVTALQAIKSGSTDFPHC
jgi:PDZ domain-containing protein